jgi:hypothetical protein
MQHTALTTPKGALTSIATLSVTLFTLARSSLQQEGSPCCLGGHGTLPYEQNTQQSPDCGRSNVLQLAHS